MQDIKEMLKDCVSCKTKPCKAGCPLVNDTTGFINYMKDEEYQKAYELLCETTVLSSICGRICPHSKQCQGKCVKGIAYSAVEIGKLESFVSDMATEKGWKIPKFTEVKNGKKVAVIGGGPSGLTCAAFLARYGFDVTIFEKHESLGGVLSYGVPRFRLEKEVIDNTVAKILDLGIKAECNKALGKNLELDDLEREFDAIYLSFGKNISIKMGIAGEEKAEVLGANELLENKNFPDFNNKKVAVIGGGNVAMDACRTIKRLGADAVTIIYRRSEEEMPAEKQEIACAKEDGVEFLFQTNIVKILGNDHVEKIECVRTQLIAEEGESKKHPVNIENTNFTMDADYVVMAVGATTDKTLMEHLNIETTKIGTIAINENYQTSREKIFAGGDLAGSKGTVAWAAKSGRDAAEAIKKYLEEI